MAAATEKQQIRAALETTQAAYHQLLAEIPDSAWEAPTANPEWNVRQMAWHITMAVDNLPKDIRLIRKGMMFAPPARLLNWLNIYYTRWGSRKATKVSVAERYDAAHARVIEVLDDLSAEELQMTGQYPDINDNLPGGRHSIADMFQYLVVHFAEHEADIRAGLDRLAE